MEYKYCNNENFEDFASGKVILHKPGFPNFPVRLALEIYGRCLNYLKNKTDICIYDPCCGSGFMMTVIGFLNYNSLETIICSDCNDEAVYVAEQNLNLLSSSGINERLSHLQNLYLQYNKLSHLQAIKSAKNLAELISKERKINTITFNADILSSSALSNTSFQADIVFTDIPYDNLVSWQKGDEDSANRLLDNLLPVVKPDSVIAICSNKRQRVHSDKYIRLEKQQIGKRKFEIFALRKA